MRQLFQACRLCFNMTGIRFFSVTQPPPNVALSVVARSLSGGTASRRVTRRPRRRAIRALAPREQTVSPRAAIDPPHLCYAGGRIQFRSDCDRFSFSWLRIQEISQSPHFAVADTGASHSNCDPLECALCSRSGDHLASRFDPRHLQRKYYPWKCSYQGALKTAA
jgi:hypothetical protein